MAQPIKHILHKVYRQPANRLPLILPEAQGIKVLVAFEESGTVREAFAKRGFDAWSCDLQPSGRAGNHLQMDALEAINSQAWDLLIAHPPCTRLCNSGVWVLSRPEKYPTAWDDMVASAALFRSVLDCKVKYKVIENSIPHGYAVERIGRKYDQIVQPHQFGHNASKATCLWYDNLPYLVPTCEIKPLPGQKYANQTASGQNRLSPGPERAKLRATTYAGIAHALARQIGDFVYRAIVGADDHHEAVQLKLI